MLPTIVFETRYKQVNITAELSNAITAYHFYPHQCDCESSILIVINFPKNILNQFIYSAAYTLTTCKYALNYTL
jgi:hypothetical protein